MNILLIQQEMGRRYRVKPVYPIGLAYIASVLRGKYTVKIFDPNVYEPAEAVRKLRNIIMAFCPEVIGISVKYIDTTQRTDPFIYYEWVRPLACRIKRLNPKVVTVAGGAGFSMFPVDIMRDIPELDLGIHLEGERVFPSLLRNLDDPGSVKGVYYRRNGKIEFSGPEELPDLDMLPCPATQKDIIDISPYLTSDCYTYGIQSKRGCQFSCYYCNYPSISGNSLRVRTPRKVVDEIQHLYETMGMRRFTFVDNVFNYPVQHAMSICEDIIKRGLDVEWSAWYDLRYFSEDLLKKAYRAGCKYFDFSPDAATDRGLEIMRKGISVADIEESISLVSKDKGFFVSYNFFWMFPGQSVRGIIATMFMWVRIFIKLFGRVRVYTGWIRILPGTGLCEDAGKEGVIDIGESLLTGDTGELRHYYYSKRSYWPFDIFILTILSFGEYVVKPVLKVIFKLIRKEYPFYH